MEAAKTSPNAIVSYFTPTHTTPKVTCYSCGNTMESNPLGKCAECIATTVDITKDAQKEASLVFCKDCFRVQVPPNQWVVAERESRELLALLLKRVDLGPGNIRIVDAEYLWTEPHSRRTKVRITVQKEESGVMLEQRFVVEFIEHTMQCPQCAKSYTHNKWVANVQIRQHVPHKKTVLWLEQMILKLGAHRSISSIEESREGIDLHFSFQRDGEKLVQFVQNNAPVRTTKSSQLVSEDTHTGRSRYKFTYSMEIAPICRDDLVVLPKKFSQSKGGMPRLVLCSKINNSVHFVDPNSCRTAQIYAPEYFKAPFKSIATTRSREVAEFIVLDVDLTGVINNKFVLANVTIAKSSDMSEEILVRTHLGAVVHEGDTVLGYDLRTAQYNDADYEELNPETVPDVIIVKKVYPDRGKKPKKLQRMAAEYNDGSVEPDRGTDYAEFAREMEEMSDFDEDDLQDAELDEEMEAEMNGLKLDSNEVDEAL